MYQKIALTLSLFILLAACGTKVERDPSEVEPTPEETPTEASEVVKENPKTEFSDELESRIGYVKKIELSIYQQGTHVLLSSLDDDAKLISVLESDTVNLTAYEGQQLEVRGTLQPTVEGNQQIMRVKQIISVTEKKQLSALEELRSLATAYDPSYEFTTEDDYQILAFSEEAGTMKVRVTKATKGGEIPKAYLVRMVKKGGVTTGAWEIYELSETEYVKKAELLGVELTDPNGEKVSETPETTEETSDKEDKITVSEEPVKVVVASRADEKISEEALALLGTLESEFKDVYRVDVVEDTYAYVAYDGRKVLLSYARENGTYKFNELASFKAGEETDWVKESGENVVKARAASVYKKEVGGWVKAAELKEGWRFYENDKYQIQVPFYWYYHLRGENIDFSDNPVSTENVLLSVDLATSYEDALAQNSYTSEESLLVGDLRGVRRTYENGQIKAILKNEAGQTVVVTVKQQAGMALEGVLEVLKLK